ncbi:MAG: alcohol dehydrogenase catalytic domain-containing protein [Spirochaetales bacterium]|nr:alcohol dehydrogenase catalytic domain-containing protein [Spirochaetales bacterium]
MRARVAFLHKPHDLRVEEVEIPALKPNEILVKPKACGICGSDVECFEGRSKEGRYDIGPYTPGHEWGGQVVEVGKEIKYIKPGDKVTADCVMQCFVCRNCKEGLMPSACLNMREGGFRPDSPGGMGEYLVIEEPYLHRIPDSWSYEEGAWVETFSIGYFGIWGNGGYVDASDDVTVFGAGPVGLSALMVAKTSNARTIMIEPLEYRRNIAMQYGADAVIDPANINLKEEVLKLTDGRGPSVVVEASGNDKAIASIFDIAGHSARVRLIGHSVGRKVPIEIGLTIWKTLSITGSGGTKNFAQRTIRFMDRIRDRFDVTGLITHRFPFEKINEAFDTAVKEKGKAIKVMLTF